MVQVVRSSDSSAQVVPATSPRRCPVKISKRTIFPKGELVVPVARRIFGISSSLNTRSRLALVFDTGKSAKGFSFVPCHA
jgi:hypothetical protein